jgi:phage-related protein (TIGR01555 family)
MMDTIDNFHAAAQSAATLVSEANVDVIQIPGMQQMLTHPQGEMNFMKRMRIMKTMKSIHNLLVLDGQEVYTNKNIALNGVKDLIWEYLRIIAAGAGVPATRFLSASPDGMNATGESDLNNYIVLLRGLQMSKYDPRLTVIDKIVQAHYGIEEYTYEWNCAFPESALQKEERRTKFTEGLKNLVDAGVIRPEVALEIMKAEHTYGDVDLGTPPPPPPEPKPQGAKP